MAWGAGAWGAVPWGAGYGAAAALQRVAEVRLNTIEVEFSGLVRAVDPTDYRDALFVASWTLTAIDPSSALVPRVQVVQLVQGYPEEGVTRTIVRVVFDADLDPDATYRIEANAQMETIDGGAISSPRSADLITFSRGFVSVFERLPREDRTDLASASDGTRIGGSLRYDETGDLANETGAVYLRKRILRRLLTLPGAILHLPGYGAGKRLKGNITAGAVARYRAEVRAQILEEPDVRSVVVSVTRPHPGILRTTVKVTDRDGLLLPEIAIATDTSTGATAEA